MVDDLDCLPPWVTWQQRPFPDANLLLLPGRNPALVDSGFVGHADQTADWVHARTGQLSLVVNTHWHADHVGGNGMLQAKGAGIRSTLTAPTWMSTPPWPNNSALGACWTSAAEPERWPACSPVVA